MLKSKLSRTTIGTHSLITCFCFIIDFIFKGEPCCILEHYTNALDESKMSSSTILLCYLNHSWHLLKTHSDNNVLDEQNLSKINNICLLVSGGCVDEGIYIRNAFLLLNLDNTLIIDKNYIKKEILFLYNSLKNNVIVLQPVTKMLKIKDKKKGEEKNDLDFPSVWINFSCKSKLISIGIRWSYSKVFNIALANIKLKSEKYSQMKWHIQRSMINKFQQLCQPNESQRLVESLSLIPNQVVFDTPNPVDISIVPVQTVSSSDIANEDIVDTDDEDLEGDEELYKNFWNVNLLLRNKDMH